MKIWNGIADSAFVRWIGMAFLAVLSGAYFLYNVRFSELHIYLSGLNFPIFAGEIALFFCFIIFCYQNKVSPFQWTWFHVLLAGYFIWVVGKALAGYVFTGPLALRNAALFYYPMTAVFAYTFFRKERMASGLVLLTGLLAGIILLFEPGFLFARYCLFIVLILAGMRITGVVKRCFFVIFAGTVFIYASPFVGGSRANYLGLVVAMVFLAIFLAQFFSGARRKFVLAVLMGAALVGIITACFDRNAVHSLLAPQEIYRVYKTYHDEIKQAKNTYVPMKLGICLYHDESNSVFDGSACSTQDYRELKQPLPGTARMKAASAGMVPATIPLTAVAPSALTGFSIMAPLRDKKFVPAINVDAARAIDVAYTNEMFRYFIWRDMALEWWHEKPLFGFSFARPQRSSSLEMLHWAEGEWLRDGYITPHNSFFHFIYRGGIIGLIIIGVIVWLVWAMAHDFIRARSLTGGLLVSILVYGIVTAQFSVFLELPYNAIPFWTFFGVTLAYAQQFKGVSQ
ncbi:MAG: O-antigen ligase family protein [Candidatus Omnitrophica bacterium]|nr:O-antigen ligase family protein [Candidatus Omnitrophota bacterium]